VKIIDKIQRFSYLYGYTIYWGDAVWCETCDISNVSQLKRIKKALSTSITEARTLRDRYLKEISVYGDIQRNEPVKESKLFGEVAQQWVKIMSIIRA